jgi:puromycin-sensitive aminopeptidase
MRLRQRRFFYLPQSGASDQLYQVPVMVRARTKRGVATHRVLLDARETTLNLGGECEWALLNEGGHGFYRVRYAPALLDALTKNLGELQPIERFGLVSDTWAATVAGLAPLGGFIRMARLFTAESDLNVWRALLGAFNYLDMIATDAERPALSALVREVVGPSVARMGWEARAGESELERQLRGTLISALGTLGDDRAVQQRAAELYQIYQDEPAKADRDVAPALVNILAHAGDERRYDEFKRKFRQAPTPQEEQRYRYSLAGFRRPELLRRTMDMTLDGQVRTQDAPYLFHSLLLNPACRYEAWEFMKQNWEQMTRTYPDNTLPRMCEGIIGLIEREDEVKKFFETHKMRLGGKLIDQHLERLTVAAEFRRREGPKLAATLKG